MTEGDRENRVLIVGGGFAGVACAQVLEHHEIETVLVDRNDYHQFQPMLYQCATAQVADTDIAFPLRGIFHRARSVHVRTTMITAVDPVARTVTTRDGVELGGEVLVLAAGARPNFFGVPGAEEHAFPLYCVDDANALRSRILGALDAVDADAERLDQGGLTFVIVGGGATGVETAGALAEFFRDVAPHVYRDAPVERVRVVLVDHGDHVLNGFSEKAQRYAHDRLRGDGVELRLGVGVEAVHPGAVDLSDGTSLRTRTVVWAGGEQGASVIGASGIPLGRGGRIDVAPDLTVPGFEGVYALGDAANIDAGHGVLPQLGSVAQQSGKWAGENIVADLTGHPRRPFHYRDKGIMAMIGRNAAVAEMGAHRHEVDGAVAFAAWLGVHSELLSSMHQRVSAFVDWGWDYFSKKRPEYLADRPGAYMIDWGDED